MLLLTEFMKKGLDYVHSPEKRALDIAVASALVLPAEAGRLAMARTLRHRGDQDAHPIFVQDRFGRGGSTLRTRKIRTLETTTGRPLNNMATFFRRYGIDETVQARHILEDDMSFTGYRPMPLGTQQMVFEYGDPALVEEWLQTVMPTKPGLISLFTIVNHAGEGMITPENTDTKLRNDIYDVENASLGRDLYLANMVFAAAATGRL